MLFQSTLLLFAIACAVANEQVIRRSVRSEFGAAEPLYSTKDFGHRSKRGSNSNSTNESSFDFNRIERNAKQIVYSGHPNVVLVLGNTGTGKSTLIQLIAGNNSNMRSEKICLEPGYCPGKRYKIIDMNGIIGQSPVYSHTSIPQLVFDVKTNTSIYDCPGFSDTRNAEYDISGAYFIRKITDRAKEIKFLFVVNYSDYTDSGNRIGFGTLIKHVTNMFKDINKFKDSFAIVANKVNDNESTDEEVVSTVASYLKNFRDELIKQEKKTVADQNKVDFINALLAKNGKNYTKIGFLRTPKEAGLLSKISAIQENKRSLLHLLHNNIHYSQQSSRDYRHPISDDSKNYIHDLLAGINKNLTSRISKVATKLQVYYNNLSQNILSKIDSSVNSTTTISDDFVEVKSLTTRLNKGYDSLSTLVDKIDNEMTLQIVLKMIDETVTILDLNIIQNSIFNASIEIQAVEFLQDISGFESRPHQDEWKSLFQNIIIDLNKMKKIIHEDVTLKVRYFEKEINSKIKNSGDIIQKYFSSKEETVWDIENLSHVIESEYRKLEGTYKTVRRPGETKKCIKQINEVLHNINIDDQSHISVRNTLLNITRYGDYLEFLHTLNNQSPSTRTFKCTDGLGDVLEFLRNSKEWYRFLINFYKELSKFKIQKNLAKWKKFADNIIYTNDVKKVADVPLEPFLKEFVSQNEHEDIKSLVIDKSKFNTLRKVLDLTLTGDLNSECIPDASNDLKLTIKGQFVKLSDISNIESKCQSTPKSIEIFALNKIFIDTDFHRKDNTVQFSIIAPTWDIEIPRKIVLDGKSGNAHNPQQKPSVKCSEMANGLPGEPGESGGAFLGIGATFNGAEYLSISANGGNGGPGQNGGDGQNGKNGTEPNVDISTIRRKEDQENPHLSNFHCSDDGYSRSCNGSYDGQFPFIYEKEKIHLSLSVTRYSRDYWEFWDIRDHCDGCNGGNGGVGGEGGYAGNIIMIGLRNDAHINRSAHEGNKGSNGTGGKHGVGGIYGRHLKIRYVERDYAIWESDDSDKWYVGNNGQCLSGNPGVDGSNDKNKKHPEQLKLSKSSDTITSYKKYVIEYLSSGSIREPDLRDFLNLLGNSTVIKNVY